MKNFVMEGDTITLTRFTRFGLNTRAVAESERGAVLSGLSPDRIAALNCVSAASLRPCAAKAKPSMLRATALSGASRKSWVASTSARSK